MLRPTTGELLAGIIEGLRVAVLPELLDGHGRRQLKAALHTLARLQRAWDAQPAELVADNEDIHRTLAVVLDRLPTVAASRAPEIESIKSEFASLQPSTLSVAAQAAANARLQGMLIAVDDWLHAAAREDCAVSREQRNVLARLFSRMVDRELAGSGVAGEGA